MNKIKLWMKAVRAPFFTAAVIPALVGAALSSREGHFHMTTLLLTLVVVISFNAGANLFNDYIDAEGSDQINRNPTPFSGGSKLIQEGKLTRKTYLKGALLVYGIGLITVTILTVFYGNVVILELGVAGIVSGIIYSATQTFGMGRGWGELAVGVAFGPLATAGSYVLQTNYVSFEAFLAGVPVGLLIMGVLILNEFPDIEADRTVGKRNWVVRAGGGRKGVWVYLTVISLSYFTLLAGVFYGVFPAKILFSCFTIPLACWILLKIWQNQEDVTKIIPAMAGNIGLHFLTGLLITIGLWWK